MRKFGMCVAALVLAGFSYAIAEEFSGTITKVEDGKITVQKKKGKKDTEAPAPKAYTVAKDAKVLKGTVKVVDKKPTFEAGEAIEGGLKNEMFSKIGEKGVGVRITTNDKDEVTQILVVGQKKKKGT